MKTCARISHLAVMLVVVSFCSAHSPPFDSSGRFVLQPPAAKQIFAQCSRSAPPPSSSVWEPSRKDLDDLESSLARYLNQRETAGKAVPPKSTKYHRQYVGFIRNGERFIYGNFYPVAREFSSYEAHQAVAVCDGGRVFWGIVYDLKKKAFDELQFNGSIAIPPPPPKN